jgi:hypothetical protein
VAAAILLAQLYIGGRTFSAAFKLNQSFTIFSKGEGNLKKSSKVDAQKILHYGGFYALI